MIQSGLYTLLAGDAGLNAIVQGRITPVLLPEASPLPALTYMVVGATPEPTFDTSGMQRLRVQFDCHAEGYTAAANGIEALRILLNGYSGTLSDGTVLQSAQFIQPIDYFDDGPRQFRCSAEYYLWFTFNS